MNYKQKLGYTTLGAAMVLIVIGGGWALTQKWKRPATYAGDTDESLPLNHRNRTLVR